MVHFLIMYLKDAAIENDDCNKGTDAANDVLNNKDLVHV